MKHWAFPTAASVLVIVLLLAGCGGGGGSVTVDLRADDTSIQQGDSTTLRWFSTDAATVVSSNFGAGSVNGTKTVSPNSTTTYRITVEGAGGQASDSVTVTVSADPGSIDPDPIEPGTYLGQEIVGPGGISLMWVPSGSFMMGTENGRSNESPVHEVELSGFWIGKTEVTIGQWRSVMGSIPEEWNNQGDDHPLADVTWNDAKEFCDKLGVELPTEAQWEYAARGPDSRTYPWGDTWDTSKCCFWYNRGPGGRTFPVGSFPSGVSWCGALDMAGNVFESCADWFDRDYYASSPAKDPLGPDSGYVRVLRGGSWAVTNLCRSAYRYDDDPWAPSDNLGFRIARNCR